MVMRGQSDPAFVLLSEQLKKLLRLLDKLEHPTDGRTIAPADVWISPDEVTVRFEIPGADPKTLRLSGHATFLEITGTKSVFTPPAGDAI
ncbi:MAG: Hsp20/alpha crystallin family protein [Deltaproteobacteria bacterium]|nr:Hsp20/alpha crystallin family protein [Deltaproteobacteria bacterium]